MKIPTISVIPINKILPNPNQPRKFINPLSLEKLKASMRAKGQQTPGKVRPLTGEEMLIYPGFEYMLLGGHRRREAALALGIEDLMVLVLDLTPEEAELAAVLDNSWEDMFWLDWNLAVESLYGDGKKMAPDGSKLTQEVLADQLGVSQQKVSFALKLAGALTKASREMIYYRVVKSGEDGEVAEKPIRALAALGDPALVEKVLPMVLDRQMTEAEAREMVESIKQGKSPESYGEQAEIPTSQTEPIGSAPRDDSGNYDMVKEPRKDGNLDSTDPFEAYWAGLPKAMKISQTKKGYRLAVNLTPKEAVPVVYGVKTRLEELNASKEGLLKTEVASSPALAYSTGAPRNGSD